ncbi:Kunitz-type trypsin inhibitor KTI1, partial [Mucuna pruriens]
MKITALFALFLLSAFISYLPSATALPVFDTNGKMLTNSSTYHLLPAEAGDGGGILAVATGNESCPLTVVQSPSSSSLGLTVMFEIEYSLPYIFESQPLYPRFLHEPTCKNTSYFWTIVPDQPEGSAVKIAGYENTLSGWFKIERLVFGYGLAFCPYSSYECQKIGTSIDESGNRRLVLSKYPLSLTFAESASSTASA